MTGTDAPTATVEVFWLPGCTSCLRMKEFVESTGVPYVAVNLDAEPERGTKLRDQGIHAPAVCVGDRCVNGVSLAAVAELLGVDYTPPEMLSPAELRDRYDLVLDACCRYVAQMPPDALGATLPHRDRDFVGVASQTMSVMRSFLSAYYDDRHDTSYYLTPDDVRTTEDLLARGAETRVRFEAWWADDGCDDPLDRVVKTYWGHRTLHEVLEREVWHTAQHGRQLMLFLELQGIEPAGPLTSTELDGLPLPERVHE
jgi:glutaredoxin